jgi:hypothetical protein
MATQGSGGSTLSALTARRAQLLKTRQRLNINDSNTTAGTAAAAGSVQRVQPVPQGPAAPTPDAPDVTAPVPQPPSAAPAGPGQPQQRDEQMLQQARDFLDQARSGGGVPQAPVPDLETAPPTVPASLTDQIGSVGGAGLSPVAQFMRIAGRPPTGREMVVFNATKTLEQQLGRAPTRNELLMHVTSPQNNPNNAGQEPVAF